MLHKWCPEAEGEHIKIILLSTAKQGDNVLGSARPSVRLFVRALLAEPFDL